MRIIFIRHGDPDYTIDNLTEKGKREATLLNKRVAKWDNITQYYVSPLGRAQATCEYALKGTGRTAITKEWLEEFTVIVPSKGGRHVPWDFLPDYWTRDPKFVDLNQWYEADIYKDMPIKEHVDHVTGEFDKILSEYGYFREGNMYVTEKENDDTTLVFFCHLGVSCLLLAHLTNIAPTMLWHSFYVAPTSLTIGAFEEREPHKASFRIQVMGDTNHLHDGNEPVSKSGYFTTTFSD